MDESLANFSFSNSWFLQTELDRYMTIPITQIYKERNRDIQNDQEIKTCKMISHSKCFHSLIGFLR